MTTKFNVNEVIFTLDGNKVVQFKIKCIHIDDKIRYHISPVDGIYTTTRYENEIFRTKEELIASL